MINALGVPKHALKLKVGAVVILLRNLSVEKVLVKNAPVIVKVCTMRFIEVELLGKCWDRVFCLPSIHFEFKPEYTSFTVIHLQFPLWLAYATMFNSCQGMALNKVVIDQRSEVLAHGQLYTVIL